MLPATSVAATENAQFQQRARQMRPVVMLLGWICTLPFDLVIGTLLHDANLFYIGSKGSSLLVLSQEPWFWYATSFWPSTLLGPLLATPLARLFQKSKPPVTFSDCMFPGPSRVPIYVCVGILSVLSVLSLLNIRMHARLTDTAIVDDWDWGAKVHPYSTVSDIAIGPQRASLGHGRYYFKTAVFVTFKDGSVWSPGKTYDSIGRRLAYRIAQLVSERSGVPFHFADPENRLGLDPEEHKSGQ